MSLGGLEREEIGPAVETIAVADGSPIVVPEARLLFGAEFQRQGTDLLLVNDGHATLRIAGFFLQDPPDLVSPEGAVLAGAAAARLAGPIAPAQYAQAGAFTGVGASPIGQVETIEGGATAQRADGSVQTLEVGAKIYQDDVVQTDGGGRVSLTFTDGTIFTLSPGSRMIIDELIYDPAGSSNSGAFNLVQGGFVFIAGQVAKTGGMDVNTPSATMGIRGTTVVVDIQTIDGIVTTEVSLTADPDGGTGRIVLTDLNGNVLANITGTGTKWIVSPIDGESRELPRTAQDDAEDSVLIAEAVAAYQSAMTRVEQGETFVTLDGGAGSGTRGGPPPTTGLGVDSVDEPVEIPPDPLPPEEEQEEEDSFDEGRFDLELDAPSIVVTGLEDPDEEDGIDGVIPPQDAGGTMPSFAIAAPPQNGTATMNADGSFNYVPNPNFNGTDSFTYVVTDAKGMQEFGTVTVQVAPVNDPPETEDVAAATAEDGTVIGAVTGSDIDGDPLTFSLASGAAHGLASVQANGTFSYVPDPDFSGTDSFEVRVSDPSGATAISTVEISVAPVNDRPVIAEGGAEGTAVEDSAPVATGLLVATDADTGATLTWSGSAAGAWGDFALSADGAWTYTLTEAAQSLAEGETVTETFAVTVTDDQGAAARHEVTLTVTGRNDGPVVTSSAEDAAGKVTEGDEVTGATGRVAATDADSGAVLSWTGSAAGLYGAFVIAADGAWSYELDNVAAEKLGAGETATESFTATVTDDLGATAVQIVTITVEGTNDLPNLPSNTVFETAPGAPVGATLTASDIDSPEPLVFSLDAAAANGTVALAPDGSFTYTPAAGFLGVDRFEYTVTDADGGASTATVTVEVEDAGDGADGVTLEILTEAGEGTPAGAVAIEVETAETSAINLVIAMDRSGSIGRGGWADQTDAVADALQQLAARFEGAATTVEVQIVSYANDVTVLGPRDLLDPTLPDAVRNLEYSGGNTNWSGALGAAKEFFDGQPVAETNYLFFVTDGNPTSGDWPLALAALTDSATNGYTVTIEAFGIGENVDYDSLAQIEPNPTALDTPADLNQALQDTPVFNPELISFELTLEADGVDHGVIADETSPAFIRDGLDYDIAFADIAGLDALIGLENRFGARVFFDLDGDPDTAEIELFTSELITAAETATLLAGSAGNDLLLGSQEDDTLDGGDGRDLLAGLGGNDLIEGGAGADTLLGGDGDDRLALGDLPSAGERVDGGAGRDVLALEQGNAVPINLVQTLDLAGIEAIDLRNAAANTVSMTLSDILSFSDMADTDLETLLDAVLPESLTIYGEAGDAFHLADGEDGGFVDTGTTVPDGQGGTLAIYQYVEGGSVLATLAVSEDVTVDVQPSA